MKDAEDNLFQAREFAELTGVTVRTLHHYDRLGLLKPSRYSRAGYRLYRESDVARLEQIVALKFIGFSLNEIKKILSHGQIDLATMLQRQREAITEKRQRLDLAISAIQRAEHVIAPSGDHDGRHEASEEMISPYQKSDREEGPLWIVALAHARASDTIGETSPHLP